MIEIRCDCGKETCDRLIKIDRNSYDGRILVGSYGNKVMPQWLSNAIIKAYNEQEENEKHTSI